MGWVCGIAGFRPVPTRPRAAATPARSSHRTESLSKCQLFRGPHGPAQVLINRSAPAGLLEVASRLHPSIHVKCAPHAQRNSCACRGAGSKVHLIRAARTTKQCKTWDSSPREWIDRWAGVGIECPRGYRRSALRQWCIGEQCAPPARSPRESAYRKWEDCSCARFGVLKA